MLYNNNVLKQGCIYRPPMKLREGNVFTRVCLSVHRGKGLHLTIVHDALDLTLQAPHIRHGTPQPQPQSQPSTSDILWPSLETCSNLFTPRMPRPNSIDIWWLPKYIWLTSRKYVFHWNAFLFSYLIALLSVKLYKKCFWVVRLERQPMRLRLIEGNKLNGKAQ